MRRGWRTAAAALFVLFGAAATFAIAGAALSDQGPGWEPEANVLGTIAFYDANGMAISGGDLSQHPAAFYAAASAPGRSNDSLAQLKMFTPQVGVAPQLWTGDTLTGATTYPNPAAPAAVAHLAVPVATGTAGDLSLADYISEFPNTLTTVGYQDLYELRLYTSGPGVTQNVNYFRVDIQVTALNQDANGEVTGVWNVVYPASAIASPTGSPGPTPSSLPTPPPTTTTTPPVVGTTATVTSTATVTATATTTTTATATATTTATVTAAATTPPVVTTATTPPVTQNTVPVVATTSADGGGLTLSPPSSPASNESAAPLAYVVGGSLTLADHSSSLAAFLGLAVACAVVGLVGFIYYYSRRDSGVPFG